MAARSVLLATESGRRRTMFIPVGMHGSGKTWFARQLDPTRFCVLNRERNKWTYEKMLQRVEMYAREVRRHLFIDTTLAFPSSRRNLADIASHIFFIDWENSRHQLEHERGRTRATRDATSTSFDLKCRFPCLGKVARDCSIHTTCLHSRRPSKRIRAE